MEHIVSRTEWETAQGLLKHSTKWPEVAKALFYADTAHRAAGQVRKYTGRPYIEHPKAVAALATLTCATPEMVAAALLHDVVEDTGVTEADLREEFSPAVVDLVMELTEPDDDEHWGGWHNRPNRKTRRALEAERRATISPEGQTLTVCDAIANAYDMVDVCPDKDFARVYLSELRDRIGKLEHAHAGMKARALRLLEDSLDRLKEEAA
jgi:guanosine-3',5'-bis(diphosphate) 3'-pyrophosphohydrolase